MSLSDQQLERFARHVVIPGVGAAGQQKLLRSVACVAGEERAADICARYLERCGVRLVADVGGRLDCLVAADLDAIDDATLEAWGRRSKPLVWFSLDGRTIRSGFSPTFDGVRPRVQPAAFPASSALRAVAAADTAACAVAYLLGWPLDAVLREQTFG